MLQTLFGVSAVVIYRNGVKCRFRARQFDIKWETVEGEQRIVKAEWRRPWLSWSRAPLFLNVDEIVAVWQGRV